MEGGISSSKRGYFPPTSQYLHDHAVVVEAHVERSKVVYREFRTHHARKGKGYCLTTLEAWNKFETPQV